jgi:hypothetical protein
MCWFEGSNGEVVQQVGIRWLREMFDCYGRSMLVTAGASLPPGV